MPDYDAGAEGFGASDMSEPVIIAHGRGPTGRCSECGKAIDEAFQYGGCSFAAANCSHACAVKQDTRRRLREAFTSMADAIELVNAFLGDTGERFREPAFMFAKDLYVRAPQLFTHGRRA